MQKNKPTFFQFLLSIFAITIIFLLSIDIVQRWQIENQKYVVFLVNSMAGFIINNFLLPKKHKYIQAVKKKAKKVYSKFKRKKPLPLPTPEENPD